MQTGPPHQSSLASNTIRSGGEYSTISYGPAPAPSGFDPNDSPRSATSAVFCTRPMPPVSADGNAGYGKLSVISMLRSSTGDHELMMYATCDRTRDVLS